MKPTRAPQEILLAYAVSARLVELYGDEFVPYFEFMEAEVAALQRNEQAVERARMASVAAERVGIGRRRLGNIPGNIRHS